MPNSSVDFAIIGSGNVAHFLAHILTEKGLTISQVHSRNSVSGNSLALKANAVFEEEITSINAAVIFIAVQDEQIENCLKQLPHSSILLYTSGTIDLAPIFPQNCGVFYPLQTFSKNNYSIPFNGPILLDDKNKEVNNYAIQLCSILNLSYKITSSDERKNIHLCAIFLKKTFENIISNDPCENQSGPAKRNDKIIINEHIALLDGNSKTIYHLITESILAKNGHEL